MAEGVINSPRFIILTNRYYNFEKDNRYWVLDLTDLTVENVLGEYLLLFDVNVFCNVTVGFTKVLICDMRNMMCGQTSDKCVLWATHTNLDLIRIREHDFTVKYILNRFEIEDSARNRRIKIQHEGKFSGARIEFLVRFKNYMLAHSKEFNIVFDIENICIVDIFDSECKDVNGFVPANKGFRARYLIEYEHIFTDN